MRKVPPVAPVEIFVIHHSAFIIPELS